MPFIELLSAERVRTGLVVRDKPELLGILADLLAEGPDREATREALVARENLGSTGLSRGVAIPHGRSDGIEHARAAFVRLARPVDFGADDGQPVDLVAALVVPAHFTDQHLRLLAELAELFSNRRITDALRSAPNDDALHEVLRDSLRVS